MRNFHENQLVSIRNLRSKMFKKLAKSFAGFIFFCNFAIPKLEQYAPNQLSFNELGKNKEILKHLRNVTA